MLSLEAPGKIRSSLFQLLVAAGIPWLVATSLQSSRPASSHLSLLHLHIALLPVCVFTASPAASLSYKDTSDYI